jgi:enamine deaminase RidA (YjgF/YER057c/UK114 family)
MNLVHHLEKLGFTLPAPIAPIGTYQTVSRLGTQLYVSGLGPFENGRPVTGIVGAEIDLNRAKHAALLTMMMILSCIEHSYGLDSVLRCARLTVYVRALPDFTEHPQVANGASDLLASLFGAENLPARSALGVSSLPMGIPVEIDSIFELKS